MTNSASMTRKFKGKDIWKRSTNDIGSKIMSDSRVSKWMRQKENPVVDKATDGRITTMLTARELSEENDSWRRLSLHSGPDNGLHPPVFCDNKLYNRLSTSGERIMPIYFNHDRCRILGVPYDNDAAKFFYVPTWKLVKVMAGLDDTAFNECRKVVEECFMERRCELCLIFEQPYGWFSISLLPPDRTI